MGLRIRKIYIKNFRSVKTLTITPGRLAILVGKNDSGKSNMLRALNLFFNGKTGQSETFQFDVDHNFFVQPNRRAKQISVRIELEIPENYRRVNGDFVVWEKRWRAEGLVYNKYEGKREVAGPRGI